MYAKRSLNVLIISLVLLTSLVFVPTAYAFDGREGQTITIGKNEVIADDLYLTAQYIVVDGTIQGDLMVGAVDIVINGTVEGDLWATGSSLTLNGEVGDDVFFAGAAATFGFFAITRSMTSWVSSGRSGRTSRILGTGVPR